LQPHILFEVLFFEVKLKLKRLTYGSAILLSCCVYAEAVRATPLS